MEIEKRDFSEVFKTTDLWQAVESSCLPIEIKNKDKILGNNINASIVLCPLYRTGPIEESDLIDFPQTITDSRIVGKIDAYVKVIEKISNFLDRTNGNLKINFVVANKGVILGREVNNNDVEKLQYHNVLYQQLIDKLSGKLKIEFTFNDYQSLNVNFPPFIDLKNPIPNELLQNNLQDKGDAFMIIDYINSFLNLPTPITNSKDNRHILKGIIKAFGVNGAFWLVAGYLVFDHKIPEMLGENPLYIVSERFDPLFSISKLTPKLNELTRIQIKA